MEAEKRQKITKMIHIDPMGEDGEETQLQMETFASSNVSQKERSTESNGRREDTMVSSKIETKSELSTADKLDKKSFSPAQPRSETEKTINPDVKDEHYPHKVRREKRPQSLNLGKSRDFVYETEAKCSNITQESVESDEDNNTELIEKAVVCHSDDFCTIPDTWSTSMTKKVNQPATAGPLLENKDMEFDIVAQKDLQITDHAARSDDAIKFVKDHEKLSTEIKIMNTEDKEEKQDAVNGPGKDELKRVKTDIRFEVMKVIMIDNNSNKEEPGNVDNQRMEELGPESKISNIKLDKTEVIQTGKELKKASLRVTGHARNEITRIVPLKPERAKSQGCKDDIDIEQDSEFIKRSFKRYSMNESFERHFDPSKFESRDSSSSNAKVTTSPVKARTSCKGSSLAMRDHNTLESSELQNLGNIGSSSQGVMKHEETIKYTSQVIHGDLLLTDEGHFDVQHPLFRTPVHQKHAPPTPPVKTKKARESVLFLRNSHNFTTDLVQEDKKSPLESLSTTSSHEDPRDDVKQQPPFILEDDSNREQVWLKDTQLVIERKCSSMTVSSTSSLEAEVDFTIVMDLHSGTEELSRGMTDQGEKLKQVEVGGASFEKISRIHSTCHTDLRDLSPGSFLEGHSHQDLEPPPVAKKDPSAVTAAQMLRKGEIKAVPHSNGSEGYRIVEYGSDHPPPEENTTVVNCKPTKVCSTEIKQTQKLNLKQEENIVKDDLRENGSPVRTNSLGRDFVASPPNVTTENVTSATTTQVTKTVKGGYAETRIEKRIIITGDDDVDQHQALAMAIQEAKQQHPDMLVTKAVVVREADSSFENNQQKSQS